MNKSFYYCPSCDIEISPENVTFNEKHDSCGCDVEYWTLTNTYNNKQQFINEVVSLMQKYNLSISHEDTHGAFIIKEYDEDTIEWFKQAILKED